MAESLIERLQSWSKPKYGLPVPARELLEEAAKELEQLNVARLTEPLPAEQVTPMTNDWAIELIARHAIERAALDFIERGWEDYPELGEHDWERVSRKVAELVFSLGPRSYDEAYDHLSKQASDTPE